MAGGSGFFFGLGAAFLQLAFGLLLALASVYMGLKAFRRMTIGLDGFKEIRKGNVAVSVLLVSVILSVAIVVQAGVSGMSSAITATSVSQLPLEILSGFLQVVVGAVSAVFAVYLCTRILDVLTAGIDEIAELKKGNLAVALMMAGVLLSVALVVQAGVSGIARSIGTLL